MSHAAKPAQKASSAVRRSDADIAVRSTSKNLAVAKQPMAQEEMVPWSQVQQLLATMQDVLRAKTSVSYELENETKVLHEKGENLMFESLRADEDSGCLRMELEKLIRAKGQLMQEKAELERQNAFLQSERGLLCEQLQVSTAHDDHCYINRSSPCMHALAASSCDASVHLEPQICELSAHRNYVFWDHPLCPLCVSKHTFTGIVQMHAPRLLLICYCYKNTPDGAHKANPAKRGPTGPKGC
jgi:hypothetical protein